MAAILYVLCAQVDQQRPPIATSAQAGAQVEKNSSTQQQNHLTGALQMQLRHRLSRRVAFKSHIRALNAENPKIQTLPQLQEEEPLSGGKRRRGRPRKNLELNCPPPAGKQPSAACRSSESRSELKAIEDNPNASVACSPGALASNTGNNLKAGEDADLQAEVSDRPHNVCLYYEHTFIYLFL